MRASGILKTWQNGEFSTALTDSGSIRALSPLAEELVRFFRLAWTEEVPITDAACTAAGTPVPYDQSEGTPLKRAEGHVLLVTRCASHQEIGQEYLETCFARGRHKINRVSV